MNEDDTFNALRREPFDTLLDRCAENTLVGESIVHSNIAVIEAAGWAIDDFLKMVHTCDADRIHRAFSLNKKYK